MSRHFFSDTGSSTANWNGEISLSHLTDDLVGVIHVYSNPLCTISAKFDCLVVGSTNTFSVDVPICALVDVEMVEFLVPLFTLVS